MKKNYKMKSCKTGKKDIKKYGIGTASIEGTPMTEDYFTTQAFNKKQDNKATARGVGAAGASIGGEVGTMLGGTIASVIPGLGTAGGAAVGKALGTAAGYGLGWGSTRLGQVGSEKRQKINAKGLDNQFKQAVSGKESDYIGNIQTLGGQGNMLYAEKGTSKVDDVTKKGYKKDSPYKDKKQNTIHSDTITMKDVEKPLKATAYAGNQPLLSTVMYPEGEYKFPVGTTKVVEKPIKYSKGTSNIPIEIEGKKAPEIHTNKEMTTVKTLGKTPHSKGGTKTLAEEGDIVFNTQNNPKKAVKIAKLIAENGNGNIQAKKELEKEKAKLPKDTEYKKAGGSGGVRKSVTSNKTDLPYSENEDGLDAPYENIVKGNKISDGKFKSSKENTIAKKSNNPTNKDLKAVSEIKENFDFPERTDFTTIIPYKEENTSIVNKFNIRKGISDKVNNLKNKIKTKLNEKPKDELSSTKASPLAHANTAYNLVQGFGKAQKEQEFYDKSFQERSLSNLPQNIKAVQQETRKASKDISNRAGNTNEYLAARLGLHENTNEALNQASAEDSGKRLAVQNSNVARQAEINARNNTKKDIYNDLNSQNQARKRDFLGAGFKGISDFAQVNQLQKNQHKMDSLLVKQGGSQFYDALGNYRGNYNQEEVKKEATPNSFKKGTQKVTYKLKNKKK